MNDIDKQAKRIYNVLCSRSFSEWYKDDGQFGCHVTGDPFGATNKIPEESEIIDYIKRRFLS